ncbi:MAG: GAF domain-containing protein [Chryseolinea sp.]
MRHVFSEIFRKQGVKIALYLVVALILVDTLLTYQYKSTMSRNLKIQEKLNEVAARKGTIISDLNNIDMSLRGFLLVGNEAFVDTYNKIKGQNRPTMKFLSNSLPELGIPAASLSEMTKMLDKYFMLMDRVTELARDGNRDEALKIIKEDHGTAVWQTYVNLSAIIDPVILQQKEVSQERYNTLLKMNLFFQIILFGIGIPTLIYTVVSLTRNEHRRITLFKQLDAENRKLIFDSNNDTDVEDEHLVINEIIANLNKASTFIKGIATGDYQVKWEGFSKSKSDKNKYNISGALLMMREGMKERQAMSLRQQWVSEGLNRVAEIIRDRQTDFQLLSETTLAFLVKYVNAQQGALFVINDEDDGEDPHLKLISCYAFDKKKFVSKRVAIGEGVLGQTFLEGEPVYLTEVPKDYVKITSGLGESNPRSLTIFPLKQNEAVVAIIEIASFDAPDQYVKDFLAGAGRSLAASIITIRSSVKTKLLLEKANQQTEELRAQEEEMRQNMEEMQATQEEMKRRETTLD